MPEPWVANDPVKLNWPVLARLYIQISLLGAALALTNTAPVLCAADAAENTSEARSRARHTTSVRRFLPNMIDPPSRNFAKGVDARRSPKKHRAGVKRGRKCAPEERA